MTWLNRLRLVWHERIIGNENKAASLRWAAINAARPRVCPCGAPGTVVKYASGQVGTVAPEFHLCAEHADVPLTVPWSGGRPLWHQSPDECGWTLSTIPTGLITECGCGTHVGRVRAEWWPS